MSEKKEKKVNPIFDSKSLIHRLLSYGVTIALIIGVGLWTPTVEGGLSPAYGLLILAYMLIYILFTNRVLEAILFTGVFGIALTRGLNGLFANVEGAVWETIASDDWIWIVLMTGMLNVFNKLLDKAGAMYAISRWLKKISKKFGNNLDLLTWILQFPLFFDDYMTVSVGGAIVAPMYDEANEDRETGAYLIRTLAEPLRILIPFTSWVAFFAGNFEASGVEGSGTINFFKTIPFNFYGWVSLIGCFLFATHKLPRLGAMKDIDRSKYLPLPSAEEDEASKKDTKLIDFFLPILILIVCTILNDWDIVPACFIGLPIITAYYLCRHLIEVEDIETCLVSGFGDYLYLHISFVFGYLLNASLGELGFTAWLGTQLTGVVNPHLFPLLCFLVLLPSECIISMNWGLMIIVWPMLLPVAQAIGANVILTAAAIISAGCLGCNVCPTCDYSLLTAETFGLNPARHSATCVPYTIIYGVITAVLYLIAGFVF